MLGHQHVNNKHYSMRRARRRETATATAPAAPTTARFFAPAPFNQEVNAKIAPHIYDSIYKHYDKGTLLLFPSIDMSFPVAKNLKAHECIATSTGTTGFSTGSTFKSADLNLSFSNGKYSTKGKTRRSFAPVTLRSSRETLVEYDFTTRGQLGIVNNYDDDDDDEVLSKLTLKKFRITKGATI